MNRRRHNMTDHEIETMLINGFIPILIVVLLVSMILLTLARIACTPAVRLVPTSDPSKPPYNSAQLAAAGDQMRASEAGKLAAFYRENF